MTNKMKFLEAKWEIEKKAIKTVIGVALFCTLMFVEEIADFLGEIVDEFGDFIYDNSGLSHSESETLVGVIMLYTLIVMCDRIGHKLIPFIAKKIVFKKTNNKKGNETSE